MFFRLFFLVLTILLTGCEKEETQVCTDNFLKDKAGLEEDFKNINKIDPDLTVFKESLSQFLNNYPDKACTVGELKHHPHAEVKKMINEIDNAQNTLSIKVIYGDDNRVDLADYPDSDVQKLASSVAAMIPSENIDRKGNLKSDTLEEAYNLCSDQRFKEELVAANCTGFLVDDDLLVTAGHCLGTRAVCGNEKWVFGYHNGKTKVDVQDIYTCKEVVGLSYSPNKDLDFAVIQLNKNVSNRSPRRFKRKGLVNLGEELIIMGHPTGMSLKIADDAQVRSIEDEYFVANLDSFGGNSGSPVFNAQTLEVEGILVRGEVDYVNRNSCTVVNTCENNECRGEDVTHMSIVSGLDQFKALGTEKDFQNLLVAEASSNNNVYPLKVNQKKGFDYNLAGKRFLDTCITHVFQKDNNQIVSKKEFTCSEVEFQEIYEDFIELEGL